MNKDEKKSELEKTEEETPAVSELKNSEQSERTAEEKFKQGKAESYKLLAENGFNIFSSKDFSNCLKDKKFDEAKRWLKFVEENIEKFPQYGKEYDGGKDVVKHRRQELGKTLLLEKFGAGDTKGFKEFLVKNEIDKAESWFDYILENIKDFPGYENNENWKRDRERELHEAKSKVETETK